MVNTFFVADNVYISASCLDNKRLNKQVVEALQIYNNIRNLKLLSTHYNIPFPLNSYSLYAWIRNIISRYKTDINSNPEIKLGFMYHPVILMWFHYEPALLHYTYVHRQECLKRGINNTITLNWNIHLELSSYPKWSRDPEFLIRHRSKLIEKNAQFYTPIFPNIPPQLIYFWPYTPKVGTAGIADINQKYK